MSKGNSITRSKLNDENDETWLASCLCGNIGRSLLFFFFCHLPFWMDEDRNGLKRLLKLTFVAVNGILKRLLLSRMVVNSVAVLIFFLLAIDMYVSLLYLPWQRFNVSGWRLLYVFFYFIHLKMQINEKSFDVTNPRLL